MEARMLQCDRVVLGELNEGIWPAKTEAEPWLNRPMRKALGLPAPERQIGLLAHDFVTLAAMPEVFITRAEKSEGAAMVPSRFLQRMEAVLVLAGGSIDAWRAQSWQQWAELIDEPTEHFPALAAPAPMPPLASRPRKLSVTAIERLIRDPYGIYAQKILQLKALDPLQQIPAGREFGDAAHKALENFVKGGGMQSANPCAMLLAEGDKVFAEFGDAFMVEALWKPRFATIVEWVLQQEWPAQSLCEVEGEWVLQTPRGDFTVTARVDRLDVAPEGVSLIDYKTGTPPSQREIELGLANQLLLAAIMVQKGGFGAELAHHSIESLSYWHLSGGRKGGEIKTVKAPKESTLEAMIAYALEKLPSLLAKFDSLQTPYRSIPDIRNKPKYNDYAHLARISEWTNN
jgi:ATP-dependent helicase/nuclease subunit B